MLKIFKLFFEDLKYIDFQKNRNIYNFITKISLYTLGPNSTIKLFFDKNQMLILTLSVIKFLKIIKNYNFTFNNFIETLHISEIQITNDLNFITLFICKFVKELKTIKDYKYLYLFPNNILKEILYDTIIYIKRYSIITICHLGRFLMIIFKKILNLIFKNFFNSTVSLKIINVVLNNLLYLGKKFNESSVFENIHIEKISIKIINPKIFLTKGLVFQIKHNIFNDKCIKIHLPNLLAINIKVFEISSIKQLKTYADNQYINKKLLNLEKTIANNFKKKLKLLRPDIIIFNGEIKTDIMIILRSLDIKFIVIKSQKTLYKIIKVTDTKMINYLKDLNSIVCKSNLNYLRKINYKTEQLIFLIRENLTNFYSMTILNPHRILLDDFYIILKSSITYIICYLQDRRFLFGGGVLEDLIIRALKSKAMFYKKTKQVYYHYMKTLHLISRTVSEYFNNQKINRKIMLFNTLYRLKHKIDLHRTINIIDLTSSRIYIYEVSLAAATILLEEIVVK